MGGPVAVAATAGQLAAINCLVDFYLVNEMIIPGSNYWNIGVGYHKGDVENDESGKSHIIRFGQNLARMMKKTGGQGQ
jgi:multimeric flavodoxin WrbA